MELIKDALDIIDRYIVTYRNIEVVEVLMILKDDIKKLRTLEEQEIEHYAMIDEIDKKAEEFFNVIKKKK